MKKSVFLILILFFISTLSMGSSVTAQTDVDYIIVYDEAHLQFFTHDLMSAALTGLNTTFDTASSDVTIKLVINSENFTTSNLQGSDLLIVPSPNLNSDGTNNVGTNEKEALTDYVEDGGSIFVMANPYSLNPNITGHYSLLTELLPNGFGANIRLGSGDGDNTTVVVDDFNNDGNNTHVIFTDKDIQSESWKSELNTVSSIVYYGASIDDIGNNQFGNASSLTYAVNKEYGVIDQDNGNVKWLVGGTVGQNDGRVVLIGSTIMFSDQMYDSENSWIDVADNQELFENLVAWLLKITPLNVPEDTIDQPFQYFLTRNILFGLLISVGLIALIFAILIRSNTITLDRIFNFKIAKKISSKDKVEKKTTKKTSKTTKAKKTTKKRRKRT